MGMGVATAGNYDVNGDGWKDFIIGAPGASAAGTESVFVYSGSTGNLIFSVGNLPGSNSDFGRSVALVGDIAYGGLQLDGKSEFIVGIPFWGTSGNQNRGAVNIYSGADGSFLYQIPG